MQVKGYSSTVTVGGTATATSYAYTYDVDGNITQIVDGNGKKISYKYDDLGQLTRENNQVLGKTYVYTYDAWGNHSFTWVNRTPENMPAVYNPFRYRGYYYDTETGLYYL